MALMYCPDCGRQVSTAAAACPNCGHPINVRQSRQNPPVVVAKEGCFLQTMNFGCAVIFIIMAAVLSCCLIAGYMGIGRAKTIVDAPRDDTPPQRFVPPVPAAPPTSTSAESQKSPPSPGTQTRPTSVTTRPSSLPNITTRSSTTMTWRDGGKDRGNQPSPNIAATQIAKKTDELHAREGERLIAKCCDDYGVGAFYKSAHLFGGRMVIWIPKDAWDQLTAGQKAEVSMYMISKYNKWGIGVGRVAGTDVLSDSLVVTNE